MAVRLTIVLAQSRGGGASDELEGALVAELIGSPGMDLSVIGSLDNLTGDHTDSLMVEGLGGDFALLGWEAPEAIEQRLRAAGLIGSRARHTLDSLAPAVTNTRRWYLFDLRNQTAARVVAALRKILDSRRTPTVSLLTPPHHQARSANGDSDGHRPPQKSQAPVAVQSSESTTRSDGSSSTPQPSSSPPARTVAAETEPGEVAPRNALDDLVDDLNAFDV